MSYSYKPPTVTFTVNETKKENKPFITLNENYQLNKEDRIYSQSLLPVFFLDDLGILRCVKEDNIPFYVLPYDQEELYMFHPQQVIITKEEKDNIINDDSKLIIITDNIDASIVKNNQSARDNLNGGVH